MKISRKLLLAGGGVAVVAAVAAAVILIGGRLTATAISLAKAEGTVEVSDDEGREARVREGMKLYSGYEVETSRKSYAWIDLDSVKLVKLDQRSEIEITKEDRELEVRLKSGTLFFQISQPLEEDESLEIRTSTMTVGIRGTCGWVRVEDREHMEVYILEGKVACTLRDPESGEKEKGTVSGGQMARLTINSEGKEGERCRIETAVFTVEDIPDFVLDEMGKIPKGVPQEAVPFDGHFYRLYTNAMTWADAKAYCEEMGGHLVSITSQEEQSFVEEYLKDLRQPCMIGLHRDIEEFGQWVTGEKVRYTNWGEGEPDNAANNQPVAIIDPRRSSGTTNGRPDHTYSIEPFQWDDIDNSRYFFLCEWDG